MHGEDAVSNLVELEASIRSLRHACADVQRPRKVAFAMVCKRSRILLGAAITIVPRRPEVWTDALDRRLRDAFRRAVKFSRDGEYGRNVCDRYVDLLVFSRLVKHLHDSPSDADVDRRRRSYRYLRLSIANLWREFIRESPDEPARGRKELSQVTRWTLGALRFVAERLPAGDDAREPLLQGERELLALLRLLDGLSAAPKSLRTEGIHVCSDVFHRLDRSFPHLLDAAASTVETHWAGALWDAGRLAPGYALAPRLHSSPQDLLAECWKDTSVCLRASRSLFQRATARVPWTGAPCKSPLAVGRKPQMSQDENVRSARTDAFNRERLRADSELNRRYPGEYVAFRDVWQSVDDRPNLCRQVIAHAADPKCVATAVREWREQNPAVTDQQVVLQYVEKYTSIPSLGSDNIDVGSVRHPAF